MKKVLVFGGLFAALTVALVVVQHGSADASAVPAVQVMPATAAPAAPAEQATAPVPVWQELVQPMAKRCSFNSDCPYGTCKSGRCGGCSFQSDCKGWGKCANGWCGACSFQSDCKGFGGCRSGRCERSPY